MTGIGNQHHSDVVRLTQQAIQAAQQGHWDVVIQCYSERGALLDTLQGAPIRDGDELLKVDEQIRERVQTVQAVLASLLDDATTTRQRLQGLRQRLSMLASAPETLSMDA